MDNNDKDGKNVKIILLGESGVGKTSIINRYLNNEFASESLSTLGSYTSKKEIIKNKTKYLLDIWDTSGQEQYHSITNLFINGSDIVILVYSIDSKSSFTGLDFWYNSVMEKLGNDNFILAIVGSKSDLALEEQVSEEEGKKFAEEKKAKFKLVSAKIDLKGINTLFDSLMDEYISISKNKNQSEKVVVSKPKKSKKKKLC
jgi:small GTP-binding protein